MDNKYIEDLIAKFKNHKTKKEALSIIKTLSESEQKDLVHMIRQKRELENPYENKQRCKKGQENKYCLLEVSNVSRQFETFMAFLSVISYIYDRLEKLSASPEEKSTIRKFLGMLFNHTDGTYIDTLYEAFVKPFGKERIDYLNKGKNFNVAYIPEVKKLDFYSIDELQHYEFPADEPTFVTLTIIWFPDENDLTFIRETFGRETVEFEDSFTSIRLKDGKYIPMPSLTQLANVWKFTDGKLEEMRFLTSALFSVRPEKELVVHCHGLFDGKEDIEAYRLSKNKNIFQQAMMIPVGYTALADNFKANNENVVIYNPVDPEVEFMLQGKQNVKRVEAKLIRDKMRKVDNVASKESLAAIKEYKNTINKENAKNSKLKELSLQERSDLISEIEKNKTELQNKISEELNPYCGENDYHFTPLKIKKGKISQEGDVLVTIEDEN